MPDNTAAKTSTWPRDTDWMTSEQVACLKALAGELCEPEAFDPTLNRTEAARRITALEARLALERHNGVERLPRT